MIDKKLMKKYVEMSPFEFKNVLIDEAKKSFEKKTKTDKKKKYKILEAAGVLNAGRGNPNFLNTTTREAFSLLNDFASQDAKKRTQIKDLGLRPEKKEISKRFKKYLLNKKSRSAEFLKKIIEYAKRELKIKEDYLVYELSDAILGDFYPSPPRIFPNMEKIINKYLTEVLCAEIKPAKGKFDLFATEGATASMVYVFKTLKENKLLHSGDKIAIMTPIFSPYLEIPGLNDYKLVQVHIKGNEEKGWQVEDKELKKLENKKVKALFMVHPTNPTSIKLNKETLLKIQRIIQTKRKDLILLTDTVYATFVDGFNSLVEVIPKNTICVYSYSKFFGVTGWRLGVIMIHENNILDELLSKLSFKQKKILAKRYEMTSTNPDKIKFIDRLEIDSRDVALAHTGGLSCPQQCMMTLCSSFYLLDKKQEYKKSIQKILRERAEFLYKNLGIKIYAMKGHTNYYALINIEKMAEEKYGKDHAKKIMKNACIDKFLLKLAKEKLTICLPGEGFAGPKWSLRISLANLETEEYEEVGRNISEVLEEYSLKFRR